MGGSVVPSGGVSARTPPFRRRLRALPPAPSNADDDGGGNDGARALAYGDCWKAGYRDGTFGRDPGRAPANPLRRLPPLLLLLVPLLLLVAVANVMPAEVSVLGESLPF